MIDIHTHILPALDDGPPDMATSVGMAHIAAEEGITTIISTSHEDSGSAVGRVGMQERLDEVRRAWQQAGVNIRLELGLEIYLTPNTPAQLKAGEVWPLGSTKFVLVELPYQPWPTYAERTLFELQMAGYVPILAHPERYTAIQADPNLMGSLAERGVLGQVTSGALLGDQGGTLKTYAEILVAHNLVQFISSDSHGIIPRKRPPRLRAAVELAANLVGEEKARAMVEGNPAAVLANGHIEPQPMHVEPKRWSLGRLFGKS